MVETAVMPTADRESRGAWYRDWRLVSHDGTTLDLADTVANEETFGRPGASRVFSRTSRSVDSCMKRP